MSAHNLGSHPIHLGRGATAVPQPEFTGFEWYDDYTARHGSDGAEGRLVSQFSFSESWDSWEMHPAGAEVVICTVGVIELIQQAPDGQLIHATLQPGDYAINPPGVWHTADVNGAASAVFITSGLDTQHRPR